MPKPSGAYEDRYTAELDAALDREAQAAAAELGPPPQSYRLSENEELDLWDQEVHPAIPPERHPNKDRIAQLVAVGTQLAQQGDLEGAAAAYAEAEATRRWPARRHLISQNGNGIEEQAEYALKMARRSWQRAQKGAEQ